MIKDLELRKGGWVVTTTTDDKPAAIQINSIEDTTINGNIPIKDLEGIELTREHLIAWGFEIARWATEPNIFEKGIVGQLLPDGFHLIDHDYENLKPQKYVHQMQNLMLDLCGEALLKVW